MAAQITKTTTIRLSPQEISAIIAEHVKQKHGIDIEPSTIIFRVSGGYEGGHGYGYVPASFDGLEVTKTTKVL